MEAGTDFIFLGSKVTVDSDCSHEIRRCLLLGSKEVMTNLGSILKRRDITLPKKGPYSQSYGFSTSHVWMGELAEHWRSDAFELWYWRRLESPLDSKEIKPANSKSTLIIHWKDWCWSSNTLATWFEEPTHWKKTLMMGKIEGKRRRGWQKMR